MKIAKIPPNQFTFESLLVIIASNHATLVLLVYLTLSIILFYQQPSTQRYWLIMLPVFLLLVNFIMALVVRRALINNLPLMVFHFSLFALVILAALGQMTYLKGTLELATMEAFSGQLENVNAGSWHDYGLADIRFINMGFSINYHKGIKRDNTVNKISLLNNKGVQQVLEIGDHVPLVIGHYRFYTSHNKGYAPVFEWTAANRKQSIIGSVHLPAYPINEYRQALEWKIPGTQQSIWTMLKIESNVLPKDREFQFQIPQKHTLIVRHNDQRYELTVGDELDLGVGILQYQGLTTWMGYKVDYDWTRYWLLVSCLTAIISLFLHYILKFRSV